MSGRRFIIVTGLSGAGKSIALHALEDAGFYCVDNLPAGLVVDFAEFIDKGDLPHYRQVVVGVDARNPAADLSQFPRVLDALHEMVFDVELIYIEASDQTLINRFSETRRRHPLSSSEQPLGRAIAQERIVMATLSDRADLRVDTTHTNIHEFRAIIAERVARPSNDALSLQVCSFGYKNGVPPDADFVFDLRCLPNPYWDPALRELSGRDQAIQDFLHAEPAVGAMVDDVVEFLEKWIPAFEADKRSYLTIAMGCTGGRHRSVYVAERVAGHFKPGRQIMLVHRNG
jgi:RNase adapter protein RapZ